MSLSPDTRARIEQILGAHHVVLFMKGNPDAPQCGFSAKAAGILKGLVPGFGHVDVLADPAIREGIKVFGQWPTIPQLYVGGELLGGSDIIEQMLNSGELHQVLGLPEPDRTPPSIEVTPPAAEAIGRALANADDGVVLHLTVDPRFNARFELKPATGHEVVAEAAGLRLHLDLASDVIDVRPAHARAIAPFPHPHEVLDEDSRERLEALPKDVPLAFLCHHGNSSRQAAEYFRQLGFHDIYNVEGGIDAWSVQIDPSVPRY